MGILFWGDRGVYNGYIFKELLSVRRIYNTELNVSARSLLFHLAGGGGGGYCQYNRRNAVVTLTYGVNISKKRTERMRMNA